MCFHYFSEEDEEAALVGAQSSGATLVGAVRATQPRASPIKALSDSDADSDLAAAFQSSIGPSGGSRRVDVKP